MLGESEVSFVQEHLGYYGIEGLVGFHQFYHRWFLQQQFGYFNTHFVKVNDLLDYGLL